MYYFLGISLTTYERDSVRDTIILGISISGVGVTIKFLERMKELRLNMNFNKTRKKTASSDYSRSAVSRVQEADDLKKRTEMSHNLFLWKV